MKNQFAVLELDGFHCADCAATIEKTVAKLGGVSSVEANYAAGKVKVEFDPQRLMYQHLVRSVEKIGYRVKRQTHVPQARKNPWRDRRVHLTLLSGLFVGLGLLCATMELNPLLFELPGRAISLATVFYLLATALGAFYVTKLGWTAVKSFHINMNSLMTIAIIGAIVIQEYVEAASLAFLFSLAEILEGYAVERARNSLRELMSLAPQEARIKSGSGTMTMPAAEVETDQILITRPGEKVALDGEVIAGASSVDQAPVTGESAPVVKEVGDKVYAGSINIEGYLEIRVTEKLDSSMISRIVQLIEEAEKQKAPSERFVDKFARIYTPVIVGLAVVMAVVPPLLLDAEFAPWFIKALTLLVIACPCALVISTPVSVVSALTSASRNGVLVKGGRYLEEMNAIEAIAFDKTGTLTRGRLSVTDVVPVGAMGREELLKIAASMETQSTHPIATAISRTLADIERYNVTDFSTIPGKGLKGTIDGKTYFIGTEKLFQGFAVTFPSQALRKLRENGKTTMLVGTDNEILGVIGLLDDIRDDAIETVARLQREGKEVIMITGDNHETAAAIAKRLNIGQFKADLLPEQKVAEIESLKRTYGKIAMVGDGINDGPALAAATVGIAMGVAGTDTALESADIALMSDDLTKLPYLIDLSGRARRIIKQNILASILIKFTLALGVLPGLVSLVTAVVVGDMGASLGVTSNAMRLAKVKTEN